MTHIPEIPGCLIRKKLGEGGMSSVYLGMFPTLEEAASLLRKNNFQGIVYADSNRSNQQIRAVRSMI